MKGGIGYQVTQVFLKSGITGNVGREAGIGAAAGGTSGLISGIFSAKEPDPVHKRYVEECLKEQGFEPAAWK